MEGILIALAVFLLAMDQQILTRTLHRPLIACTIFGMLLSNTAIIVGQGEVEHEATENTYDDYIMTVSRAVVVGLINENIEANALLKNGGTAFPSASSEAESPISQENLEKLKEQGDQIMDDAQSHGHIGYITAADHNNRTLWLFFYDDQEECNTIIAHIREDIVISE